MPASSWVLPGCALCARWGCALCPSGDASSVPSGDVSPVFAGDVPSVPSGDASSVSSRDTPSVPLEMHPLCPLGTHPLCLLGMCPLSHWGRAHCLSGDTPSVPAGDTPSVPAGATQLMGTHQQHTLTPRTPEAGSPEWDTGRFRARWGSSSGFIDDVFSCVLTCKKGQESSLGSCTRAPAPSWAPLSDTVSSPRPPF